MKHLKTYKQLNELHQDTYSSAAEKSTGERKSRFYKHIADQKRDLNHSSKRVNDLISSFYKHLEGVTTYSPLADYSHTYTSDPGLVYEFEDNFDEDALYVEVGVYKEDFKILIYASGENIGTQINLVDYGPNPGYYKDQENVYVGTDDVNLVDDEESAKKIYNFLLWAEKNGYNVAVSNFRNYKEELGRKNHRLEALTHKDFLKDEEINELHKDTYSSYIKKKITNWAFDNDIPEALGWNRQDFLYQINNDLNMPFVILCDFGNLELAKELYRLEDIDASYENNWAFLNAKSSRHKDVLRWLATLPEVQNEFQLSFENIRDKYRL
jgi:hypothetical protein